MQMRIDWNPTKDSNSATFLCGLYILLTLTLPYKCGGYSFACLNGLPIEPCGDKRISSKVNELFAKQQWALVSVIEYAIVSLPAI